MNIIITGVNKNFLSAILNKETNMLFQFGLNKKISKGDLIYFYETKKSGGSGAVKASAEIKKIINLNSDDNNGMIELCYKQWKKSTNQINNLKEWFENNDFMLFFESIGGCKKNNWAIQIKNVKREKLDIKQIDKNWKPGMPVKTKVIEA